MKKQKQICKVVMTLIVKDEDDILEENIIFHLNTGVDLILAMDNNSSDGTTDILKKYKKTGSLIYFLEPSQEYLQDKWATFLAHQAYFEHQADWIIHTDADEFFIPNFGNIMECLAEVQTRTDVLFINRHDFIPIKRPERLSAPIEMIYRKADSLEWFTGKPILPKIIHKGFPDMQVTKGNHNIHGSLIKKKIDFPNIETFHYPIRSFQQFEKKIKLTGIQHINNINSKNNRYFYWYSMLEQGKLKDVYDEYCLDEEQIQAYLENGDLLKEQRLSCTLIDLMKTDNSPLQN